MLKHACRQKFLFLFAFLFAVYLRKAFNFRCHGCYYCFCFIFKKPCSNILALAKDKDTLFILQ